MLKTKDGHEVTVGTWIYDTAGIYEVIDICYGEVRVREVSFDDNGTEDDAYNRYHLLGDTLVFTSKEVSHMYAS